MKYLIYTSEGFQITIDNGPNPMDFTTQLNDRRLYALTLAEMVLAKNMFKAVVAEVPDAVGTHEVHTMDGNVFLTDIVDYNAADITARVNDVNNEFIQVGNVIVQRHNFKMVRAKQPATA